MASRTKRAQAQKRPVVPFILLVFFTVLLFVLGVGAASAMAVVDKWLEDVPEVSEFENFNNAEKTRVYANDGTTLLAEFYMENREPVEVEQVSPYVFNATVAVEDERFWQHEGVDMYGIMRAAVNDLFGGDIQGASTITQQLVRQTVLQEEANDITAERKVREIYLALELEKAYSKESILMMYLNTINYGDGAYGIQSAAQHYFSKNAADLNLAESALLAGIPQQPTYNNPVYYPENAESRRNDVLGRMLVNGYISQSEHDEAVATPVELVVNDAPDDGIYRAHYFTAYVRNVLEQQLTTETVFTSGLTVYTTIDLNLQAIADEICLEREATVDPDVEMGITSVDPRNGYILAMRGGKDFYNDQWSTCTDMRRAAGSSFKVFGLIAAIEQGYSPKTMVSASAVTTWSDGTEVSNYEYYNYGTLSLEGATWISSNTAYVRVVKKIGPASIVDAAQRCGIKNDLAPVDAIVLGSEGVNTLEMASAFGTIGNNGVHVEPTPITKILDSDGNIVYEHVVEGTQALSPEVAYATTNVLKGVITNGTAHQARIDGHVAAGKTGISDDSHDCWFVGYTPQLSTAMWLGARERRNTGYTAEDYVCAFWGQYMSRALEGQEAIDFPVSKDPVYKAGASFLTQEEQAAAAAAAAQRAKDAEAEAARAKEEEANATEEEAPPAETTPPTDDGSGGTGTGGTGTTPGTEGGGP